MEAEKQRTHERGSSSPDEHFALAQPDGVGSRRSLQGPASAEERHGGNGRTRSARAAASAPVEAGTSPRPRVRGPFLFVGGQKFTVKGVTYGTFATSTRGDLFPEEETLRLDLELMRRAGINTLRTYTPPSNAVLEHARAAGLRVLVGIHWEGRDCVFDDPSA